MKDNFIKGVIEHKLIKLGEVKLKSGLISNVYLDLRELTQYRDLLEAAVELLKEQVDSIKVKSEDPNKLSIVGVPYGVVPIAGAIAVVTGLTYRLVRKEEKEHGRTLDVVDKSIKYIIIEDVMSTGSSIIETIRKIDGNNVTDVVVIVDRELGGMDNLRQAFPHIRVHSILKLSEILAVLPEA